MYFDIEAKTEKKDLFGAGYALASLLEYISDDSTRMIIIRGLRRTGKTSLLNVALAESEVNSVKIDVRESPYYDRREFFTFLIKKIKTKTGETFLERIAKKISGLGVSYHDFSATVFLSKEENFMLFFEDFNKQLAKKRQTFVLAFDEAQLLKKIGFDFILASIFDNYKQVKFVLSGSEVGLLDRFLGKHDYEAPLYGRACAEIELKRMKPEETMRFIEEGSKQIGKKILFEEMKEVVEHLDGIIGWITYYGWERHQGTSHEKAIEKAREYAGEIVRRELALFLKSRKAKEKYRQVLAHIAKGRNTWKELKEHLAKVKVGDSQLNLYLKELLDYGFVQKEEGKYSISDPILLKAVKE